MTISRLNTIHMWSRLSLVLFAAVLLLLGLVSEFMQILSHTQRCVCLSVSVVCVCI